MFTCYIIVCLAELTFEENRGVFFDGFGIKTGHIPEKIICCCSSVLNDERPSQHNKQHG